MKKAIALLLIPLLFLPIFVGCGTKTSESSPSEDATPSPSVSIPVDPSFPSDGTVNAERENDTVKVEVKIPSKAGTACSLLLVTDPSYQYGFANGEGLCDIAQIALDDGGEAIATLRLNGASGPVYLIVTTNDGAFMTLVLN